MSLVPVTTRLGVLALACCLATGCGGLFGEEGQSAEEREAAQSQTSADLQAIMAALESYKAADENGLYPAAAGMDALAEALEPRHLREIARKDQWGHEIDYTSNGRSYVLISPGPDGKVSTGDDLMVDTGKAGF